MELNVAVSEAGKLCCVKRRVMSCQSELPTSRTKHSTDKALCLRGLAQISGIFGRLGERKNTQHNTRERTIG